MRWIAANRVRLFRVRQSHRSYAISIVRQSTASETAGFAGYHGVKKRNVRAVDEYYGCQSNVFIHLAYVQTVRLLLHTDRLQAKPFHFSIVCIPLSRSLKAPSCNSQESSHPDVDTSLTNHPPHIHIGHTKSLSPLRSSPSFPSLIFSKQLRWNKCRQANTTTGPRPSSVSAA